MPRVRYKNDPNRMEFVSDAEYFRRIDEFIKPYDPDRPGFMPYSANANRHGVTDADPERSQWSGDTIHRRLYGRKPDEEESNG